MFDDLGSINNLVGIVTGVGGFCITIGGAYYQFILKPDRAFRDKVLKDIEKLKADKGEDDRQLKDFKLGVDRHLADFEKDVLRDIDNVRRDQENFIDDVKDRFNRVDAKNEKLLDLIIRYFSEKE